MVQNDSLLIIKKLIDKADIFKVLYESQQIKNIFT